MVVHLLLKSAFQEEVVGPHQIHLQAYQAIVSRRTLAKDLNLSPSTAWRTLEYLVGMGIVDHQVDQGFSLVTLLQPGLPADPPSKVDHQADRKRPSVNHPQPGKVDRPQQPATSTPPTVSSEAPRKVGPPENGEVGHNLVSLSLNERNGLGALGTSRAEEINSREPISNATFNLDTQEFEW